MYILTILYISKKNIDHKICKRWYVLSTCLIEILLGLSVVFLFITTFANQRTNPG